jgi:hypothetical protein
LKQTAKKIVLGLGLCIIAATGGWAEEPLVPGTVYHWFIGLNAGYANNTLYTTSQAYHAFNEYRDGDGFTISVPVRYQFFPWLGVLVEPAFIQKNYSIHRTDYFTPFYNDWTNSFVDVPLLANVSVGIIPRLPQLRLFVNAGGWLGFWADSRIKGTAMTTTSDYYVPGVLYGEYSYDEQVAFDSRRDNRFDAGLIAGLGIQYSLKLCTFNVECRYYYSLTDLQKDYMYEKVPKMNDTFVVQAGLVFNASVFDIFKKGEKK